MKRILRVMFWAIAFGIIAALGLLAWVRLAPVDVATWHAALPTDARILEGDCAGSVSLITTRGGGQSSCSLSDPPQQVLARLDAIAMATPRTIRIAGSPEEGRITWETRSRLMGYPDYTTAQVTETSGMTRLDIIARQRFGLGDMGVNAARLKDWLSRF
jgi:Protein of unknown function (DUF1499)